MTASPPLQLHQPAPAPDPSPADPVEAPRDRPESGRPASLAAAVEPLLLRAAEAARLYGVSPATWHRWVSAGRVPAPVRIGATVRWRSAELAAHIQAGCPPRREWQALEAARQSSRPR
jgi:predicted DNA-binding transcriptional regulator AlpA